MKYEKLGSFGYRNKIILKNLIILFEKHDNDCKCSYCFKLCNKKYDGRIKYGLNIPENKSRTSWFVIKYWKNRYIRFTLTNSILKIFWKVK